MDKYSLPEDDSLPIRVFREWTTEKLDYLQRYISMFENSMRDKPWRQRSYIDLFAGTEKLRIVKNRNVYLGPALLATETEYPFTHYYFADNYLSDIDALKKRCQSLPFNLKYFVGNANKIVKEMTDEILSIDRRRLPNQWSSLNLAFLDSYNLELKWKTVETLAQVKKMDLIIY